MNFTIEFVHEENARLHAEFEQKHKKQKDKYSGNTADRWKISETIRGLYVMEKWQREGCSGSPVAMLRHYSVSEDVVTSFVKNYLPYVNNQDIGIVKTEKRKDKYGSFEKWAEENRGNEFTTEEFVEVAGFSYQTTLKYVSESPLFIKVKKGRWRIANLPVDE